ncbi:MAG: phosphate ABC transporter permease subunit PstC [Burkholderiaceae bacterium]|jgi:phosphate transport system permease protein|nr:phosphate ABC transporter permease subunit PstC [Burkholderiaceae bacterium]
MSLVLCHQDNKAGRSVHSFYRTRWQDSAFYALTLLSATLVLLVLAGMMLSLLWYAIPAFVEFGPGFLSRVEWDPVNDEFGALIAIFGTLVTSCIAMLLAVPVSFGIALFITELCPISLRRPLGVAIEVLAAIPSIVFGMWGLFVLAPILSDHVQPFLSATLGRLPGIGFLFNGPMMGIGLLTAGIVLAVMVIPFISSVMRDAFKTVPPVLKEAAYAVGCTRWEVMCRIVLPHTRSGVSGGIMLGLGRALGETMAVTFVIGNTHRLTASLFAPGNSITSTLANEFTEATSRLHTSSLFALGLILFGMTFVVLLIARFFLMKMAKREGNG